MAGRLDTPRERGWRFFHRRRTSIDGFDRFAEMAARFMGSPRFILYMTIFVVVWIVANVLLCQLSRTHAQDPYPFILLNLAFSIQTSYSAPLIPLTQSRQDDRDRVQAQQDRQHAEHDLTDTGYPTREITNLRLSVREATTRDFLCSGIRDLLDDLREDIRAGVRGEIREELRAEIQAEPGEIGLHPEATDEAAPSAEKAEGQSTSFSSRALGNLPNAQANIRRAQHTTPSLSCIIPLTLTSIGAGRIP